MIYLQLQRQRKSSGELLLAERKMTVVVFLQRRIQLKVTCLDHITAQGEQRQIYSGPSFIILKITRDR